MLNFIFKIHFICILIYIQVNHRFSSTFDVSTKSNKKQKWTCAYTKRNINIQYFKIEQERIEITINCLFIWCAVCLRNIPIAKVTRYGTRLCRYTCGLFYNKKSKYWNFNFAWLCTNWNSDISESPGWNIIVMWKNTLNCTM